MTRIPPQNSIGLSLCDPKRAIVSLDKLADNSGDVVSLLYSRAVNDLL
jgi:hypothetical protein